MLLVMPLSWTMRGSPHFQVSSYHQVGSSVPYFTLMGDARPRPPGQPDAGSRSLGPAAALYGRLSPGEQATQTRSCTLARKGSLCKGIPLRGGYLCQGLPMQGAYLCKGSLCKGVPLRGIPLSQLLVLARMWEDWLPQLKKSVTAQHEWFPRGALSKGYSTRWGN